MQHPNYSRDVDPTKPAHISDSGWDAPELGRALMETPSGQIDALRTTLEKAVVADPSKRIKLGADFANELLALLGHIEERLKLGLIEAWISRAGYDYQKGEGTSVAYDSLLDTTAFLDEPEEKWARSLCEQFVFCMYHSPGQAYGYGGDDMAFYRRFPEVRPIAVACQNLSTYAVLSRGVPLSEIGTSWAGGCSCSAGTVDYPAFDRTVSAKKPMATPSSVTVASSNPDPVARKAELDQLRKDQQADIKALGNAGKQLSPPDWFTTEKLVAMKITPGSIVVYNAGGSQYVAQDVIAPGGRRTIINAHTASVLRVSGQRIQFIDTGPLAGSKAGEGGTTDHSFLFGPLPSADSLVGVGVLRDCSTTLADFAKKTADSRPLGLMRLVITRTASNQVVFVSKLVHMRWPVSRLIWSLRNLPPTG